jgi:hypothetical protein
MDDRSKRGRIRRIRILALTHTSGFAIGFQLNQLQPFHELQHKTIVLRIGLRLGFIQPMGNA